MIIATRLPKVAMTFNSLPFMDHLFWFSSPVAKDLWTVSAPLVVILLRHLIGIFSAAGCPPHIPGRNRELCCQRRALLPTYRLTLPDRFKTLTSQPLGHKTNRVTTESVLGPLASLR